MVGLRLASVVALSLLAGCSKGDGRQGTGTSVGVGDGTGSTGATSAADDDDATASGAATTSDAATADGTGTSASVDTDSEGGSEGPALPCDADPASCDAWFLPRGANAWDAVTIGGPAALAPGSEVLAAFDIEAERVAYVLTIDEVIEVDLEGRTWVAKTNLADRFPEIDATVYAAYSIPAAFGGMPGAPEGITIAGSDVAFLYAYAGGTFTYDQTTAFGAEWEAPGAPAGTDVRTMWLDVTNADGWIGNDPSELCNTGRTAVGPYLAVVTDDQVHAMDVGICFGFFPAVPYAEFPATALAGAPPTDRIGGATYNETTGLVVFAQ